MAIEGIGKLVRRIESSKTLFLSLVLDRYEPGRSLSTQCLLYNCVLNEK